MNTSSRSSRLAKLAVGVVLSCVVMFASAMPAVAQDDIADVRSKEYRLDESGKLRYVLIGAKGKTETPPDGYKVLVVLPGGDGGAGFEPFVKRIYKHALGEDYLVVQLIAPKWNAGQRITWPIAGSSVRGMKVPVERFLVRAVEDVAKRAKIDRRCVFTLSWSSGGPAAYAASLADDTPVTGNFVAMSVFKPRGLDLKKAKGKAYYILHSPEDRVCPYRMAKSAQSKLSGSGATVEFAEYSGGHGWRGNVWGNVRAGIEWLEGQAEKGADR